jgi:MFS family permease
VAEGGWGWDAAQTSLPFSLAVACFAVAMLIGGRVQDKIGPRWVMTVGGVLCGLGLILSGIIGNSPVGIAISFGVIAGIGGGVGYACATPPALKWFHPSKKGQISGITVGGFGLSAVYYAPLTAALLAAFHTQTALVILGAGIFVLTTLFAQFVKNPPTGYLPAVPANYQAPAADAPKKASTDFTWKEMMRTPRFWLVFIMFVASASVGLMVIGNVTRIANVQMGITDAGVLAMMASLLAFVNTFGRILGGALSDKIGRVNALYLMLILQVLNMIGFMFYNNLATLILGIVVVGFCFGAFLSIFPALTADQYGLKNFGQNYGIMFLAWGVAGIVGPMIASFFFDATGNFYTTYIICAVMTGIMIFVNFIIQRGIASQAKQS